MPRYSGPVATIGQINRPPHWIWFYCDAQGCGHKAPWPLAPFIILYGPDTSTDYLRKNARCSKCGRKGATIQVTSWGGTHIEYVGIGEEWRDHLAQL